MFSRACSLYAVTIALYTVYTVTSVQGQEVDPAHAGAEILEVKVDGDIMIGGLFPIHEDGSASGKHCAAIKPDKGVQRMEAMMFAVNKINTDSGLLPGLKLGMHILDTCHQDTHGLEQTLEFIRTSRIFARPGNSKCSDYETNTKPIAGVIGAANSQVSAMVANVLRLFKIPQISYSSTSTELSDKSRFEFFSRVVPPDDLQAEAMVDVVDRLRWTYVSAVADEGNYGEQGMEQFQKLAKKKNICLATYEKIRRNYQDKDFTALVAKLASDDKAKGVVMFVNEDNAKKVLKAVSEKVEYMDRFAFVASDSWGNKRTPVVDHPQAAHGAITIQPKVPFIQEFDTYFTRLMPNRNKANVWFEEFWKYRFNCTTLDKKCEAHSLAENHIQEGYVPFVFDAVYVMAHAINNTLQQFCDPKSYKTCSLVTDGMNGTALLNNIRNNTFFGFQREQIEIDSKGDRMGRYNIFQFDARSKDYNLVGTWTGTDTNVDDVLSSFESDMNNTVSKRLTLNMSNVEDVYPNKSVPKSACGVQCQPTEYKSMYRDNCCWQCISCPPHSRMPNDTACIACAQFYVRDALHRNECVHIIPRTMEWSSPWAIIPATVAVLGMTVTLFAFAVFVKYDKTPVVMASGRELCYMMLVGIFFAYLMTFAFLHRPDAFTCAIQRVGVGTTLTTIYASILTKTSRLARIFTSNVRSLQRPRFISPRSQVMICSLFISVQFSGSIIWLIVEKPDTEEAYETEMDKTTTKLTCNVDASSSVVSLTYPLLLICLCTVYAVKTRKIPENFNETKHIGFTMYATCIIWLSFVPIYFGVNNNFMVQLTSISMCISISATVALVCIFAPKLYIVLLQPNKNVRPQGTASSFQKIQMGVVQQQMRFLRPKGQPESTMVASQASQYTNVLSGRAGSTNGDLRSEESSAATSFFSGSQHVPVSASATTASTVSKRRRSSALKLIPHSESRHNRVGTLPSITSSNISNGNNTTNNTGTRQTENRQSPISSSEIVSTTQNNCSLNKTKGSSGTNSNSLASFVMDMTASGAPDETTPFLIAAINVVSKGVHNLPGINDNVSDRSISRNSDLGINTDSNLLNFPVSKSPRRSTTRSLVEERNCLDTTEFDFISLASPTVPKAWSVADPRSEFEIILTEISAQEGTFV